MFVLGLRGQLFTPTCGLPSKVKSAFLINENGKREVKKAKMPELF